MRRQLSASHIIDTAACGHVLFTHAQCRYTSLAFAGLLLASSAPHAVAVPIARATQRRRFCARCTLTAARARCKAARDIAASRALFSPIPRAGASPAAAQVSFKRSPPNKTIAWPTKYAGHIARQSRILGDVEQPASFDRCLPALLIARQILAVFFSFVVTISPCASSGSQASKPVHIFETQRIQMKMPRSAPQRDASQKRPSVEIFKQYRLLRIESKIQSRVARQMSSDSPKNCITTTPTGQQKALASKILLKPEIVEHTHSGAQVV